MEGEINKTLDNFFSQVRSKGLRAIAYCDKEEGRVLLLELMEFAQEQEVALKQIVSTLTDGEEEIIVTNEDGIDEKDISELGPVTKLIETNESKQHNT